MQRSRTLSLISIYSLVAFSSMMLAFAEEAILPQCLTPIIVVIGFIFVERMKRFSLSTFWGNLMVIAAILMAAQELFFGTVEARLLSGAHLLVYLTWILLLQKKQNLHYWSLITISLLQVALGAVLTKDGTYGLLLLLYLVVSIWTLSLFWIQQIQDQFAKKATKVTVAHASFVSGQTTSTITPLPASYESFTQSGVCFQPGETWLTARFVFGVLGNILGAFLLSTLFFVLIPRLWLGSGRIAEAQEDALSSMPTLTGFTEEVTLGDFGTILESTKKVLEVKMYLHDSNKTIDVEQYARQLGYEEPYFRGTVLENYERGSWKLSSRIQDSLMRGGPTVIPPKNSVRQEYELEPIGTDKLFAIHPFAGGLGVRVAGPNDDIPIIYYYVKRYLILDVGFKIRSKVARKKLHYKTYSPLKTEKKQQKYLPVACESYLSPGNRTVYTTLSRQSFPKLIALSKDVASRGDATTDQLTIAKRLETFLRDTGGYTYTLEMDHQDKSIDPVEDFLINRKSGHCEYYASALTLMLRAVDIPARLVNGFKGGKKNTFSGAFEVQQRHAHAWVEAYIDGYWIVLDATPATRAETVENAGPKYGSWTELKAMLKSFWDNNVVQMSYNKQNSSVYTPAKKSFSEWWSSFSKGEINSKTTMAAIKEFVTSPSQWFSIKGGIVSVVLAIVLGGMYFFVKRVLPKLLKQMSILRKGQNKKNSITVDFYERFRKLCSSKGLIREPSQTQLEFAQQAVSHLNADLTAIGSPAFPKELVTSFYDIRFGNQQVLEPQQQNINQLLTLLEQRLAST